jgi:hypothetical protein
VRRSQRKIPKFTYKNLNEEHDKCDVGTPHLFIIITDEVFDSSPSDPPLRKNEIVLSPNLHSAAIGPLLALLRQHNHMPINLK